MKKYCLFLACLLGVATAFGQKVSIEHSLDQLGEGYNPTFRVKIPHATEKQIEKKWSGFLKDNDAKVRTSKGQIKGENTVIKGLGSDTLQVFSRIIEDEDGVLLKIAFVKGAAFVSPTADPDYCKRMETILNDFAMNQSKDGLNKKIEVANDQLLDSQKDQKNLIKTNERLAQDNENMKKRISENENTIQENTKKSEDLKIKIEGQQKSLEILRGKFTELK